jgi:DNA-binding NtrC family response regulator
MSLTIHVIDDDENTRLSINEYLKVKGYEIVEGSSLKEAKEAIKSGTSDIILLDVNLPDGYGLNLLSETAQMSDRPPIIMITAYGDIEMAVDAMRNGAHDFISKPISDMSRLESSIKRAEEIVKLRRQMNRLHLSQNQEVEFVVGNTNQMKLIMDQAQKAAKAAVSVLITGESGTGKEVLARYIHKVGPRSHKLFWPENCAAIQSTMIEAELFGFEAHAFTGADKKKIGLRWYFFSMKYLPLLRMYRQNCCVQ